MTTATEKRKSKRRRGNGEGCIFQRKDGKWCATIGTGYDRDGKPVRKWLYAATKRDVQEKLTRLQSRKLDGVLTEPGRLTVKQFLDKWLETTAKPSIRATTYVNYEGAIENHIALAIGGRQLAKLTPADVQGMYAKMEGEGASAYTRRLAHAVLRRACKQALKWGLIVRNPVDAVDAPRIPTSEIHPLTAEQSKELLTAAKGDRLEALYVLALTTGMRLGELLGLQWSNVDLEARCLTVCHALQDVSGKLTLTEPKTAKSRRKVELSQLAATALAEHRKRSRTIGGHVFRNSDGGPIRRTHFRAYCFKPLLKKAGLPHMRFHDLRHTAASLLLAGGQHIKVVQEILGHSTPTVTLNVYSHTMPTMQREAVDCLGSMLTAAAG